MGSATYEPKWWTEKHASQWANLKEALHRDWEQTKADLHLGGHDIHQDIGDTLEQAAGAAPIPPSNAMGTRRGTDVTWDDAEQPMRYGVGAREQYGQEHMEWNDKLESTLKSDWESAGARVKGKWDDVKDMVRHGYERARR